MITLKGGRELFLDDYIVDTERTDAGRIAHHPIMAERVMEFNMPWEGDLCGYPSIIFDEGVIRLYYRCNKTGTRREEWYIAYAESRDGIHFTRPDLDIYKRYGSGKNNIIIGPGSFEDVTFIDNISFFKDENPNCPPEEKYKAVMAWDGHGCIISMFSHDGIHWRKGEFITDQGAFDSLNLAFYDTEKQKYFCYFRGQNRDNMDVPLIDKSLPDKLASSLFDPERLAVNCTEDQKEYYMRSVRVVESLDFKTWSDSAEIDFSQGGRRMQLYTNGVKPYPRSNGLLIGTALRYVERKKWTDAFDQLCDRDNRITRTLTQLPREGLSVTDSIIIFSRDGYGFGEYGESFIEPGEERDGGWVYGDCMIAPGTVFTKSAFSGADDELSYYVIEDYRNFKFDALRRYRLRVDGFVSMHAGGEVKRLVTKEFIFSGDTLLANLRTSARGHVRFKLISDGAEFESCEYFGNSTGKRIRFENCELSSLAGKPVRLEIELYEADLYSFEFL